MLDTCNWGCLHIRITVDVLVVELSQRATLQACRPLPRLRQGEGEIKMEGTMEVSYAPRRYGSRHVGLVSERDAVQPSICIKGNYIHESLTLSEHPNSLTQEQILQRCCELMCQWCRGRAEVPTQPQPMRNHPYTYCHGDELIATSKICAASNIRVHFRRDQYAKRRRSESSI